MKNLFFNLMVNIGLLLSGLLAIFSGLLLQLNYHIGNHGSIDINNTVLGVNYFGWSNIHKLSIVILSLLMIFHIYRHWKWYGVVVRKRLFAKNRQVLTLSVIFVLVAVTGLIPWMVDLLKGDSMLRKAFIEIHDKLAIIFSIYLMFHIVKRLKWFLINVSRPKNM